MPIAWRCNNGVYDEDYGYITLEAFFAGKPVITHTDSGGPLEFVTHEHNGLVTEPNPVSLGNAIQGYLPRIKLAQRKWGVMAGKV